MPTARLQRSSLLHFRFGARLGDQVDLPAFLSQALEFVIGIAESPLRPSLAPLIGEMPYALLAYSQMTTPVMHWLTMLVP